MYSKTFIPDSTSLLLRLPENFVGEQIRIVAVIENDEKLPLKKKRSQVAKTYSKYPRTDLATLNFNREEANDNE